MTWNALRKIIRKCILFFQSQKNQTYFSIFIAYSYDFCEQ